MPTRGRADFRVAGFLPHLRRLFAALLAFAVMLPTVALNLGAVLASVPTSVGDAYVVDEDDELVVGGSWLFDGWSARREIALAGVDDGEPVAILIDSSGIDYTRTSEGGRDVRFATAGGQGVSHEIASWVEGGESTVLLHALPEDRSAVIWMYYGNTYAEDAGSFVAASDLPAAMEYAGAEFGPEELSGVLANDTSDGPVAVTLESGPANATSFTLHSNGSFVYVPAAGFSGEDTFSYRAVSATAVGEPTTVSITVLPIPDDPAVADDVPSPTEQAPNTLAFESVEGQPSSRADFTAEGRGYDVILSSGEVALTVGGGNSKHEVNMGFRDGAADPEPVGLDPLITTAATPLHASVGYRDIYPGIDVTYSADGRELEYSFTIQPGAEPSSIALEFSGVRGLEISEDGTLLVDSRAGRDLKTTAPYVYQEVAGVRISIDSSYMLNEDGTIGFAIGEYDPTFPLTIDPTFKSVDTGGGGIPDGGTIDLPVPAGVGAGDLIVAQVAYNAPNTGSITPSAAGWNLIGLLKHPTLEIMQGLYWREATGSEPAQYSFTLTSGAANTAAGAIAAYTGVDTTSPIDAVLGQTNGPSTSIDAPSITTTQPGTTLIGFFAVRDDGSMTPPDGMTERWDINSAAAGVAADEANVEAADELLAVAGATGGRTATAEAGDGSIGHLLALAPAFADSDGDGLWDNEEDANVDLDGDPSTNPGPDTDGDLLVNYLDADDDGDGTPTASENADPNGDGDPRDAFDSDRDGQPDYLDDPTAASDGTVGSEQKISHLEGSLPAVLGNDDIFGRALAAIGDLDGDGIVDVAVGAQQGDDGGLDRGAVHILFLNANGTVKSEQTISALAGGLGATLANGDQFGSAVAGLGDLDGDGINDIAVGAQYDDDEGLDRGAVYVLFLNANGTVKGERKISDTSGGLASDLANGDQFGRSAAGIGDLDGDGLNDLAVGAFRDNDGGLDRGAIYVLFLNSDGTVKDEQKISDTAGGFLATLDDDDRVGSGVAGIGDLDGDGNYDIVAGAQTDDDGGNNRGAAYVLFLNAGGTVKDYRKISDTAGGFLATLDDTDRFGRTVGGVGDLDGDGNVDVVVGTSNDGDGGDDRGAVYVLFLNAGGTVKDYQKISNLAGGFLTPLEDNDQFGGAVAGIGDIDDDGRIDLAVGAFRDDDGGTDRGAVYVLHLAAPAATNTISGTVFEDIAGDVLNDGAIGDANNPGAAGLDVYLYEDTDHNNALTVGVNDTLISGPVATNVSGAYSFSGLPDETYFVVVDSRTVPSAQAPATPIGDIWAVQTYGPAGAPCANGSGAATERGTPGPCYAGITSLFSDSSGMPIHRARVIQAGASTSNVDFGFSFNVVVNTRGGDATDDDLGSNRTVQGSLRQFIQNANAISGANTMRFVPTEPTDATDGGGNDWWSVPVTVALPTVTGAATTIDGTAVDLTDGAAVRDTNSLGPELELNGTGTAATVDGLLITGGTSAVRDLAINRFGRDGIRITTAGSNTIAGNYLGTGATGTADLGNVKNGIFIVSTPSNTIGGLNAGDRNVISGNNDNGLLIDGVASTGNIIQGNYVGLNAAGTAAIGNTDDGVDLSDTPGNTVGGTDPAARNVIGGQGDVGLLFVGAQTTGNVAVNNYIGTNASGDAGVPNGTGASVYNAAAGNRIGGVNANEPNQIAYNTGDGVWLRDTAGADNAVLSNSIHSNGGLGIDADLDGVTANGPGDPLNFPVITSATEAGGTVTVDFDLDVPDGNYRVEFFTNTAADPSGNGEGETFISSVDVSETGGVPTPASHAFAGSVGDIITATATEDLGASFGSTSEFSVAHTVTALNNPPVFGQDLTDRTDAEASPISLSAGATDPDVGDALTYSATGLPLGLLIDSATGLISGLVNYYAAASSPYSVQITVDDGNGGTATDSFTWTITNVPTTDPYVVANAGGANGGDDLLTEVDPLNFDPTTNEVDIGTGTGTNNLLGMAIEPLTGVLFASDGDRLGTLNVDSGVFTPVGFFGAGDGKQGVVTLDDVRGLAFHPLTGELLAVHHRPSDHDLLFPIDPNTGGIIPGTFNAGRDYAEFTSAAPLEVTDIAIDPTDWETYGMFTDGIGNFSLRSINRWNGATNLIGSVSPEVRGLSFDSTGLMWGTDGNTLFEIDKTSGAASNPRTLDNGSDYQAVALAVPPYYPPSVEGTIFEDVYGDAVPINELVGDSVNLGFAGATVRMYRDDGSVPGEPDASDTLYASKATGPTGHYYFSSVPAGIYWLTVDSATLSPHAGGSGWPEQTYGPVDAVAFDGSYSFAPTAGPLYGGMRPNVSDDAALLPSSEHVVRVDLSPGEEIEQVDLGFSFNVVTNTLGGGGSSSQGSLRRFIDNANSVTGTNVMRFVPVVPANDGTSSWWSLAPTTALPAITDAGTTINGTAYDSSDGVTVLNPNTAGPEFELRGSGAGGYGIEISADTTEVRGVVINRFASGIALLGGDASVIAGNYLGPDATGMVGEDGNSDEGIYVYGATNTVVGGSGVADRNVISGNRLRGVFVDDYSDGVLTAISDGTQIIGNFIGIDSAGAVALPYDGVPSYQQIGVAIWASPDTAIGTASSGNVISGNSWHGIYIWGADSTGNKIQGNTIGLDAGRSSPIPNGYESATRSAVNISSAPGVLIGGDGVGEGNVVASNSSHGVVIFGVTAIDNTIVGNSIFGNGGLGIDLQSDGVTPNDAGDVDNGAANNLLNFPVVASAYASGGIVTLSGTFDVPAGWYRFEFFTNTAADPTGYGEGETSVGSAELLHTGTGDELFGAAFPGSVDDIVTATLTECTDSGCTDFNSTSEYSGAVTVVPGAFVVNSTGDGADDDTGDGVCHTGSNNTQLVPECTLRAAIEQANATPGADTIEFNIPIGELPYAAGVWTIQLTDALPLITGPVAIDATTQPGWAASPLVRLDGASTTGATGLQVGATAGASRISGLMITRFDVDGIHLAALADGVEVSDNWIGSDNSGSNAMGNGDDGIDISGADAVIDGNVVNHSGDDGIDVLGPRATITGNLVGLEADGASGSGNFDVGIALFADDTTIGGSSGGERNTISNNWEGIEVNSSGNTIQGNYIGTDATGTLPRGNRLNDGIEIQAGSNNLVGGATIGEGNVIAHNDVMGVEVRGGTANSILGNSIYSNGGIGIELGTDGVTPNDAGDVDPDPPDGPSGPPNGYLNFPVIASAYALGGIVTLSGTFDVPAGWYRFEFFKNTIADPSGYGEGETFVGSAAITHTGSGDEPWGAAFPGSVGDIITATLTECTDSGCSDFDSTSEFSASYVVTPPNSPPVAVDDADTTPEDVPVVVDVAVNDSDIDGNLDITTAAATTVPANGSTVDNGNGTITYTPNGDWSGADWFDYEICDTYGACSTATVTVTVAPVNDPPVLALIGPQSTDELVELAFTASASDVDVPPQVLSFSLVGEPAGAVITAAGVFAWTPTEAQGPGTYTFDVEVTDGIATDVESVTVTVGEVNVPPVLALIGPQAVSELTELAFTASASDVDDPVQVLSFSLVGEPAGASITSAGVFTWTPSEVQGPGVYTFDVIVSDGVDTDSESVTVTVVEGNTAPVLALIGPQSTDELVELAFTATATDVDDPVQVLSFSLVGEPAGASITSGGVFTWTPSEVQGPGVYTFDVVVSDGVDTDSESVTVTVVEGNTAPVLALIGPQSTDELVELAFTATATDVDDPVQVLSFSLVGEPAGASITSGGVFTWTPSEVQGPGVYTFDVIVSDGVDTDSESVTVTVVEGNTAPVLALIGPQSTDELVELAFTATATDVDDPVQVLSFSLVGEPAGASITAGGVFTWTPSEVQGPGVYTFDVIVSDGVDTDSESVTVTVVEGNTAPVLALIGPQSTDELVELAFTATATDVDDPVQVLSFSLVGEPAGASITSGGVFTWTPSEVQGPGVYTFDVIVSDGVDTDSESVTVTVVEGNTAPVLALIGPQSTDELVELAFTATATDVDDPVQVLSFSLVGEPAGASITSGGVFTWTPSEVQGPGVYTFDVIVSDGVDTDSESVTVTVVEGNTAPVLALIGPQSTDELVELAFTATATDVDDPVQVLSFSLVGEPAGASITSGGVFTWTPTEVQGPGVYTFDVIVSDGVDTDSESVTVTVGEVNVPPVLALIGPQSTDELVELAFTATATDVDDPVQVLSFSLVGEPLGAAITAGGDFTWTPTEGQGPGVYTFDVIVSDGVDTDSESVTVTVGEVNVPPVLALIGPQSTDELVELAFTATATDVDDPVQVLSFSLVGEPLGAAITAGGDFTWTPTEGQGPGVYTFDVVVSDGVDTDSESVTVTVGEVNVPPVLALIGPQSTDELVELAFTATATDVDLPPQVLSFSLVGEPLGAAITAGGDFTWTPTEGQGPGVYTFDVVVSDGVDTDSESVTVTVGEVNVAPTAVDDSDTTPEDVAVTVDAAGNDSDVDGNLDASRAAATTVPANGTTTDNGDGTITYTPASDFNGVDTFDYEICDTIGACATATVTITVTPVNDPPAAVDDTATTAEDTPVTIPVLTNDSDVDLDSLSVAAVSDPPNGSATVNSDGTITYNPDADFFGIDSFVYALSDSNGGVDFATVAITVTPVNDAPTVVDDAATTAEDTPVTIPVLANDFDVDGTLDPSTVAIIGAPSNGGTAANPNGSIDYSPAPNFNGVDTFVYLVCDNNGACSGGTVTVTVAQRNDAPVLGAVGDRAVDEHTDVSIGVSAADVDGDVMSFGLDDGGAGLVPTGATIDPTTGVFSWTPSEVQGPGVYTFDIVVTDDGSPNLTDAETITITVGEVNEAPVAEGIPTQSVVGGDTVLVSPSASDSDVPVQSLVWRILTGPGTVLPDGSYYWATRAADGPGTYAVTLEVSDGVATDAVSFDVNIAEPFVPPPDPPVNREPIANADDVMMLEDAEVDFAPLANDIDPEGGPLSLISWDTPTVGTMQALPNGLLRYQPPPNFNGAVPVAYTIADDAGATARGLIAITVVPVNDAPVSRPDSASLNSYDPVTIAVLDNDSDVDGDSVSIVAVGKPSHGKVRQTTGGQIIYDPDSGWTGEDHFTYTISDALGVTATTTVSLEVTQTALVTGKLRATGLGVGALPLVIPEPEEAEELSLNLLAIEGVSLLASSFWQTVLALQIPLVFLLLSLGLVFFSGGVGNVLALIAGRRRYYSVVMLGREERLIVYAEPNVDSDVINQVLPTTRSIYGAGRPRLVNGVPWTPIELPNGAGWAPSRYLVEEMDYETFLSDRRPARLVDEFVGALRTGGSLKKIVSPRGLAIALSETVTLAESVELASLRIDRQRSNVVGGDRTSIGSAEVIDRFLAAYDATGEISPRTPHSSTALLPSECQNFLYLALEPDATGNPWLVYIEYRGRNVYVSGLGIDV